MSKNNLRGGHTFHFQHDASQEILHWKLHGAKFVKVTKHIKMNTSVTEMRTKPPRHKNQPVTYSSAVVLEGI